MAMLFSLFALVRVNAYLLLVSSLALEFYDTACKSKQCVVTAAANIVARMDLRASLAHEDIARKDILSVCALDA